MIMMSHCINTVTFSCTRRTEKRVLPVTFCPLFAGQSMFLRHFRVLPLAPTVLPKPCLTCENSVLGSVCSGTKQCYLSLAGSEGSGRLVSRIIQFKKYRGMVWKHRGNQTAWSTSKLTQFG